MRQFYLILLTLGVMISTSAQTWTTYTTTNTAFGLSSNNTHAIVIDHHNNKWVGTQYGVCKYDGTTWTQYNIFNSNNVYALTVDPSGNVWAGGGNGVQMHNGTNWVAKGLLGEWVQTITCDQQGHIWVGTQWDGAMMYDGTNWTTYNKTNSGLATNTVNAVACDAQGTMWFGTDSGVNKLTGTTWSNYDSHFTSGVLSIAFDRHGTTWFGTDGSVDTLIGTAWGTYYYSNTNQGMPNGMQVGSILIDSSNTKWFGSANGIGVTKYDGITWHTYDWSNSSLPGFIIGGMAIDQQGAYWFATDQGLAKLSGLSSGIETIGSENQVTIYPTVTENVIHIQAVDKNIHSIQVYDMLGKVVWQTTDAKATSIDVSGLPNGTYIVAVKGEQIEFKQKVVKQ